VNDMKDIIYSKPVRSWSDCLEKWRWYMQYACLTQDGTRIDTNMITGDTEQEVLEKAEEIERKYNGKDIPTTNQ